MHGDETVGRQLLLYLAHYLLHQYNKYQDTSYSLNVRNLLFRSETVNFLMDNTEIYLMPTLNPDGFQEVRFDPAFISRCTHR